MRNLIISLSRDHGKTVLVSSHLLSEMEQMASRMIIIDRGKKIVEGEMRELLDPAHVLLEVVTTDPSGTAEWIGKSQWARLPLDNMDGRLQIKMDRKDIPSFTRELVGSGADVISVNPRNSLEEYFLSLTSGGQYVGAH
jgi:ABC-type multidrug transport system ATPase subunit